MSSVRCRVLAGTLLLAACRSTELPHPPSPPSAPRLEGLPVGMTVKQRSTTAVPGSEGAVRLTIDDITRGQVLVTLIDEQGGVLLGTTSFAPGSSATFRLGGEAYLLTLKGIENALLGEDSGTFEVSAAPTSGLSEVEKIERLLAIVAALEGAKFIRNGAEHSCGAAAGHLRSKWRSAFDRIATAREFVEQVATRSSASGEPYRIRLGNGEVVLAGSYLRERLAEIERRR